MMWWSEQTEGIQPNKTEIFLFSILVKDSLTLSLSLSLSSLLNCSLSTVYFVFSFFFFPTE